MTDHTSTPDVVIRVQKLGDQILRVIGGRIVNGELRPGEFAPSEQEICKEFGVSKTVAREILAALVAKRLIDVRQGRRPEVRQSDEWDLFDPLILELQVSPAVIDRIAAEMHAIRTLLEPEVAAWAAASITDEQLAELEAAMTRMKELRGTPERFEADVRFHLVLARATGNGILVHLMESLRDLMRVSVQQRAEVYARSTASGRRDPHRAIYDAIAARDPDAARAAMRAHMLSAAKAWGVDSTAAASA